jgi:hypothetical protein
MEEDLIVFEVMLPFLVCRADHPGFSVKDAVREAVFGLFLCFLFLF